ncbi:MAG: Uma2 family endonuclease [Acidimicrobiaceae bacterium]|nr:Uma2 family endonuclease [Acidimicrobiaceae bacterium]
MITATEASPATLLTADEFMHLGDEVYGELIRGVFCEMPRPGLRHGQITARLCAQLVNHVEERQLGTAVGEVGVLLERGPDTVRAPDAAFISHERLPKGSVPDRYDVSVPELVAEVVSPSDRRSEVDAKARMWVSFGVLLVWAVFPKTRTVEVYRAGTEAVETLTEDDSLDGGDVLPGFTYPLIRLFAD